MNSTQSNSIKDRIRLRINEILKIDTRVPEKKAEMMNGDVSPFLIELFGEQIMLSAKVAQSIHTTFGMSFYEQVCKELAEEAGFEAHTQYKLLGHFDVRVAEYLHKLLETTEYNPNRTQELNEIKKLSGSGTAREIPDSTVDVYIKKPSGEEYFIDITTVKPNKKEFRTMKRKLLTWAALRYSQDKNANIHPYIAIPYNPESNGNIESTDYSRHSGYYDRSDLLVGNELWQLVSGDKINIIDLQIIFQEEGEHVKDTINKALT